MKIRMEAYAIIMAGGNGERFWPMSTPERPKQFVTLFGGKPLIRHAADRLRGLVPPERTLIITAVFRRTLKSAITVASRTDAIVTVGIEPDHPATGFGYIECSPWIRTGTPTEFHAVRRFVEKPDETTAKRYLRSGRFCWNSGMFIWKVSTMEDAFVRHAPDIAGLIGQVASAKSIRATLKRAYPPLRVISVDYAVMERAQKVVVARSEFKWDDVGSWTAIQKHFPVDAAGNTCLGKTALLDTGDSIVVSEGDHLTAVLGVKDVVIVQTPGATLVCAKSRVQDIKKLVRVLKT